MQRVKTETAKQIRIRRSLEFAYKQASRCRHDKYEKSCLACPLKDGCHIQIRINGLKEEES